MMNCDIIIPVWNNLALTRACIDSVLKNTDAECRIIIIDNASDEETRRYLEGLKALERPPVTIIRNEKNLGFVKAVNQGIAASNAPCVCVLNNDTVVTKGWLKEMIGVLNALDDIGIVNPSSNNLGQRPARGETVEVYAEKLRPSQERFAELGSAIGFCMLIKRAVIDRIGRFDEIYGIGNFEDTDYSRRAVKEGYKCVRACRAYVWHKEGGSFVRTKEFDSAFKRNKAIYEERWGKMRRILYRLAGKNASLSKDDVADILNAARMGNWVHIYMRKGSDLKGLPGHSNILIKTFPTAFFKLRTDLKILTKKKRFDEIFDRK